MSSSLQVVHAVRWQLSADALVNDPLMKKQ